MAIRLRDRRPVEGSSIDSCSCRSIMRRVCCNNASLRKGHWTCEEDERLKTHMKRLVGESPRNWSEIPKAAGVHRSGKSCRLRWVNYLKSDLKRGEFSRDEEDLIVKLHSLLGNRWSVIAGRIPGRTDNEIKNYWHSHLSKKANNLKHKSCAKGISIKSGLPLQRLTWLEHGDILVLKESPSICSSQQDCSNGGESYGHSSALSPSRINSQPTTRNLNWTQCENLELSTMQQQLQADISKEQAHSDVLDWDSLEDLTVESNGLLELLEWL